MSALKTRSSGHTPVTGLGDGGFLYCPEAGNKVLRSPFVRELDTLWTPAPPQLTEGLCN